MKGANFLVYVKMRKEEKRERGGGRGGRGEERKGEER